MPDDFKTNALIREAGGIHKAGNYSLGMISWLVSARFYENINYYDLIATALTFIKGSKLNVTKKLFYIVNE